MIPPLVPNLAIQPKTKKALDVGIGRYDVVVEVGPSYNTKRQEAVAAMMALIQANPAIFPTIGDLMIRNMDWPMAKEIADRLKKMLPPQLQDQDANDIGAQYQQLSQQHAALVQEVKSLTQQLQQAMQTIATKQVEAANKKEIAEIEARARIAVAEITTKAQSTIKRMQFEHEAFLAAHESAHDLGQAAAARATQAVQPQPGEMNEPEPEGAPTGAGAE